MESAIHPLTHPIEPRLYEAYFSNLLVGNRRECLKIVNQLQDSGSNVYDIYVQLFQAALYDIGTLWEQNKISVAVEHLATSITEMLMLSLYPAIFAAEHCGKKALIACVADEFHQLGAKMVADIFELNGWDGYFLGANTPLKDLTGMIQDKKPDVLGLSLSIYFNFNKLITALETIRREFPEQTIMVGGQAFQWGGIDVIQSYDNVHYVADLYALKGFIRKQMK